jgi:phenylalanine-4-hydroxylase
MQNPVIPNAVDNQSYMQNQPIPQTPISSEMLWVLNETEAMSYAVAPNNSVILWDKNKDTIYIKSANMQGVPSMRILDYTERNSETQKSTEHECHCASKFVPIETFNELVGRIDILSARVDGIVTKAKAKKEESENC